MNATQNTEANLPEGQPLGVTRWVHFAFVGLALATFWLLRHLVFTVWNYWQEPKDAYVTGGSLVTAVVMTIALYKHARTNAWAYEVVGELSRVSWPPRQETWYSTVIVVITSLIASLILFGFDAAWSSLTDMIYGVS